MAQDDVNGLETGYALLPPNPWLFWAITFW